MKGGLPARLDNHGRRIDEYIPAMYMPVVAAAVSKEQNEIAWAICFLSFSIL